MRCVRNCSFVLCLTPDASQHQMSPELSMLIGPNGSQRRRKAEAGQSSKAQALELQSAKSESCFGHFLAVRLGWVTCPTGLSRGLNEMIDVYKPFLQCQAQKCVLPYKEMFVFYYREELSARVEVMHVLAKLLRSRQQPLGNGHQWLTPSHCYSDDSKCQVLSLQCMTQ